MRKLLILTVALAASSAAVAAAASAPAVPRHSQLAIKHRTVRFAYVPARIPVGWRYYKWTFAQVMRGRFGEALVEQRRDHRVDLRVDGFDAGEGRLHELGGLHLALAHQLGLAGGVDERQLIAHVDLLC